MEMILQPQKTSGFIKRNYIYIAIISVICMFGLDNKAALVVSMGVFIMAAFFSSNEDRLCWSLFLVPNIRIYDSLGYISLVNILLCVPFLFYILRKLVVKRTHLIVTPIVMASLLFIMEYIHVESLRESSYQLCGWVLSFLWCCYVTLDESVNINKTDVTYALSLGIVYSAVIYLVNNPWFTSDIINKIASGNRFEAYADDPNYYSLYICLSLAGLVVKRNLKLFDFMLMLLLIGIGLMTASKMCFLLMSINLFYLIAGTNDSMNKYIRNFFITIFGCFVIYVLREYISQFIDILLQRTGAGHMDMNTLTTGRFAAVTEYLELMSNDSSVFMFGKGFAYDTHLRITSMRIAHNTYLDFILSWGIIGTLIFSYVMSYWFRQYRKKLCTVKYTKNSKFPFFILALSFFSLSCFSAGMFYFIIAFCLVQLEPVIKNNKIADAEQ